MGVDQAGGGRRLDRHAAAGPARPSSPLSIRVCGVRTAASMRTWARSSRWPIASRAGWQFPGLSSTASTWTATAPCWPAPLRPCPTTSRVSARPFPPLWNISLLPVKFFSPVCRPMPPMPPSPSCTPRDTSSIQSATNPVQGHQCELARCAGRCRFRELTGCDNDRKQFWLPRRLRRRKRRDRQRDLPRLSCELCQPRPRSRDKVLTVLATDRYDAKAFFSNYGRQHCRSRRARPAHPVDRPLSRGPAALCRIQRHLARDSLRLGGRGPCLRAQSANWDESAPPAGSPPTSSSTSSHRPTRSRI